MKQISNFIILFVLLSLLVGSSESRQAKASQIGLSSNSKLFTPDVVPNDGLFGQQHGLAQINASDAWDITKGDASIWVAVIDSGIDMSHPDLMAKITNPYDFVDNDNYPQDDLGHGTLIAGIIGASTNNGGLGTDIAGISWYSKIVPFRVCENIWSMPYCPTNAFANAILAAADIPQVKVINISLGIDNNNLILKNAIDYAYSKGKTIVAATGNDNRTALEYPSAWENVIAVNAINQTGDRWVQNFLYGSNYGNHLDLSAPGVNIWSTTAWNTSGGAFYEAKTGTSFAAPFVSGVAALIYSVLPEEAQTPYNIKKILETTATDRGIPGWDQEYGWGIVNAFQAVWVAKNPPMLNIKATRYFSATANQSAGLTLKIRDSSTKYLVLTKQISTDVNGYVSNIRLDGLPSGRYDIIIKTNNRALTKQITVDLTAGNTQFLDFGLQKAGDYNNDDQISALDLAHLLSFYRQINWDLDVSGDGFIGANDLADFLTRYRQKGDDFYYGSQNQSSTPEVSQLAQVPQSPDTLPRLWIMPSGYNHVVGEEFNTYVLLTTNGNATRGVDAILRYDPCALQVVSISNGTVFSNTYSSDDPNWGAIDISSGYADERIYTGTGGSVATIRFRAIASGSPKLLVEFKPGATIESNVSATSGSSDTLGSVSGNLVNLTGSPTRPAITGVLTPNTSSYLNIFDVNLNLGGLTGCGNAVADSVKFEAYYDSVWNPIFTDTNRYDGLGGIWSTSAITDQVIPAVRAVISDTNGNTTIVSSNSLTLDRIAPTTVFTAPLAFPTPLPGGYVLFPVSWSGTDNLAGVKDYDVQYKWGFNGSWIDWKMQTTTLNATLQTIPYFGMSLMVSFRIRARDNAGNISAYSPEVVVPFRRIYLPITRK